MCAKLLCVVVLSAYIVCVSSFILPGSGAGAIGAAEGVAGAGGLGGAGAGAYGAAGAGAGAGGLWNPGWVFGVGPGLGLGGFGIGGPGLGLGGLGLGLGGLGPIGLGGIGGLGRLIPFGLPF